MKFKIQIVIDDENQTQIEDVISLESKSDKGYYSGISLHQSKQLLKHLQQIIVLYQSEAYTRSNRACPCCNKQRRMKGYHDLQYKTVFGTVVIPSMRLYHCKCSTKSTKTFSILKSWLPEHTSPELQYLETKWASYMSFNKTTELMQDVLPINATHNPSTVRNHLQKIAKQQEQDLEGKPLCISGCANGLDYPSQANR